MVQVDYYEIEALRWEVGLAAGAMNVSLGPWGLAAGQMPTAAFGNTPAGIDCYHRWISAVVHADRAAKNLRLALETDNAKLGETVTCYQTHDEASAEAICATIFDDRAPPPGD